MSTLGLGTMVLMIIIMAITMLALLMQRRTTILPRIFSAPSVVFLLVIHSPQSPQSA